MSAFSRCLAGATLLGLSAASAPAGAVTDPTDGAPRIQLAQTTTPGATAPQSQTDPRKPGEPPAAAQPPQEGHSPLPVKPSDRNTSETGQPAQSVPPGHKAKD